MLFYLYDYFVAADFVGVASGPELGAAMISGDITVSGNIPNNQIGLINAGFDVVAINEIVSSQFFDILVGADTIVAVARHNTTPAAMVVSSPTPASAPVTSACTSVPPPPPQLLVQQRHVPTVSVFVLW